MERPYQRRCHYCRCKLVKVNSPMDHAKLIGRIVQEARKWAPKKLPEDVQFSETKVPEADKYYWRPVIGAKESNVRTGAGAMGWHAQRIQRQDFCVVLIGDLIHWQLHDPIVHNMLDTLQARYGDLAYHLGFGPPLCPLPNDMRLKFVRDDLLSPIRPSKIVKLKDTIILGATHQTMDDKTFQRRLTDTLIKIRKARPNALIIYRNNPVGYPNCPSKANGFNSNKVKQNREQQQPTTIKSGKFKGRNLE
ncbi:hypothetical protein BGZ79_003773 [Entomortierella chlamydospora]|nr:hypothetical protein BGZ79_003773 [Entomortierella chlamydospora]